MPVEFDEYQQMLKLKQIVRDIKNYVAHKVCIALCELLRSDNSLIYTYDYFEFDQTQTDPELQKFMYTSWDALVARNRALPEKCQTIVQNLIDGQHRLLGISPLQKAIKKIEKIDASKCAGKISVPEGTSESQMQCIVDYFFPMKKSKKINSNVKCLWTFYSNVVEKKALNVFR